MTEEKKKDIVIASLVAVPTQTTIAFKLEDESIVEEKAMLLNIYNILKKIEKSVT